MKLKIALLAAGAATVLAGSAFAGDDKAKGDEKTVERVVIIGGPEMDHDMGPGDHDVMIFHGGPDGMHAKMDANGDGVITKAEFMAMHEQMWAKLDANNNGKIDKDEMDHGPMMMGPGGPHGPGHPGGPMRVEIHRGGPDGADVRHGPEDLDANKDGKVSFDEFAAPLKDVFAHLDKDKSGYLEKGEEPDGERMKIRRIEKRDDKK